MCTIKLKSVTKIIKGACVLDNIDMNIKAGLITGFKGINGSGKTMLMRLIIGLIKPTQGKIFINQEELGKDMEFARSIGFLVENPSFLNSYSAKDNLLLLAEIKNKIDSKDIELVLDRVGLANTGEKKYKKFSLGMKQRLGIAAAVMEKPDLIVLDEPTNALDVHGVNMVKKLIQEEKSRGATIILSCHDASFLNEISDEVFYLEEGKLVPSLPTK